MSGPVTATAFPLGAYRVHVAPKWGKVSVANIDRDGIETWIAGMTRKGCGATTVIRAYGVLSGILAIAVTKKRLAANPATGVENLPSKIGKRRVYLTTEDVQRLANESGEHRALVLLLAYTGLRWGEAIGLRVRDCGVPAASNFSVGKRCSVRCTTCGRPD